MAVKESKVMGEAVKCLYELSEEENIRLLCEGRERYRMDMDCAREEGLEQGLREGIDQGILQGLVDQVCKKIKKNCSVSETADMLEEEEGVIQAIYDVAEELAPDYDVEAVMERLRNCQEINLHIWRRMQSYFLTVPYIFYVQSQRQIILSLAISYSAFSDTMSAISYFSANFATVPSLASFCKSALIVSHNS